MRCLVVGFGSIGKRHAQVLRSLGHDVFLVSSQSVADFVCYTSIEKALENKKIEYVVIANSTHLHFTTLVSLINQNYQGIVLIEKPLFAKTEILPKHNIKKIYVAYNLRFCEPILYAKKFLENEDLISFSAYVGQYLPTWRKNTDYRQSYSAKKSQGGGVLRDLSHELDYSAWICGQIQDVTAIGGKFSDLQIDSDDVYSILMRCSKCPIVNIQINYLDRAPRREILIQTKKNSMFINLMKGEVYLDGEKVAQYVEVFSDTYTNQHKAVINGDERFLCDYENALNTVFLINNIEKANEKKQWIKA
jgi:predicted dehydrogenase